MPPYNPGGIACYAFVTKKHITCSTSNDAIEGQTIHSEYGLAAEPYTNDASSNNVAEYTGIIKALEWMLLNKIGEDKEMIIVRGDSQLIVNQIKGKWKVRAPRIVPLRQRVMSLISKFKAIDIEWVPREQNKEADILSNKAYQEAIDNNPALREKVSEHLATEKQLELLKS
jgi:ribonuclease HI